MAVKAQVLLGTIGGVTRNGAALPIIGSDFRDGAYSSDISAAWQPMRPAPNQSSPLVIKDTGGIPLFWNITLVGGPAFARFIDYAAGGAYVAATNNGANQPYDILLPEGQSQIAGKVGQGLSLIAAA